MQIGEFILVLILVLGFLTGLPIGVWHIIHTLRRKHRLELEADEREKAKHLAEDFAQITRELTEGSNINYSDYVAGGLQRERQKVLRKR